jgi:hypothetical protein
MQHHHRWKRARSVRLEQLGLSTVSGAPTVSGPNFSGCADTADQPMSDNATARALRKIKSPHE